MRRFRYFVSIAFALVLLFGFSCGNKVNPKVTYKESYRSYTKVLKQWTREKKSYDKILDTIMLITATYESRAFRKAYLAEKIRAEAIPEKEANRLIHQSNEELEEKAVFFVTFYTPELKWNRLDSGDPAWRLWLIDANGLKVAPFKVERIRKISLATTRYYPYWDRFSYCYKVTFPRKTESGEPLELEKGEVTFMLAGVYGKSELTWNIQ